MPDPKAVVLQLPDVSNLLWRAATAMSMDLNSDMLMKDTEGALMKVLRTCHNYSPGLARLIAGRKEGSFAMEFTLNDKAADLQAASLYNLFCTRFVAAAASGPVPMANYLQEKVVQMQRALANIRYKATETGRVNDEVIRELNNAIDTAQRIKTVAEVAMVVLGAFVPLSWVWNSALSAGYTLTAEIVSSLAEVQTADIVAFAQATKAGGSNATSKQNLASNGAGALGNIAQDVTGAAVARTEYLAAKAQAENIRLAESQTTRVWGYVAQSGENLTSAQTRNIANGAAKLAVAEDARAAAVGANALAKGAQGAARGGSILVGLFFMRESLEKAWVGQTAWEEEQRHKAHR